MTSQVETPYQFGPQERPLFPGSPFSPMHTTRRRVVYACTAVCTGIGATFPNGLTNANVGTFSGSLGLYVAEASVLPAIYVAMNASANLTLVKARAQFGIPQVTLVLLGAYAIAAALQIVWPGLVTAALVRAANGMSGAGLVTLTIYYLLQIFPPAARPLALVGGIGLTQIGPALARVVPVDMLAADRWRGLRFIELGLALGLFALVALVRLPPSERSKAFEPLDLVTIALVVPAMLLVCQVIGLGRVLWWTDTPWLGWLLLIAIPMFTVALLIERGRARPLIQLSWLGTFGMLRFVGIALLVRLALAEQTYGSVGLLTAGGLTNDQLHRLFVVVALAMALGMVTAGLTLSERRLPMQIMVASLIIAAGAMLDSRSTNLSRPDQLLLSQALLGFGTTLFVGPSLVFGFLQLLRQGGGPFLATFIVAFSTTQNVGGLLGSALLGTYQTIESRVHAGALSEHLLASDPDVVTRLAAGQQALAGALVDPAAQAAQGAALLSQALQREATVLAYDEIFRGVAIAAIIIALYLFVVLLRRAILERRAARSTTPR